MKTLKTILILASLAVPAFAANVQLSNVLPSGASSVIVRTDASGNVYVAGYYEAATTSLFVAKVTPDGSQLLYFSPGGSVDTELFFYYNLTGFAVAPDGSAYVVQNLSCRNPCENNSGIYKIGPSGGSWQCFAQFNILYGMTVDLQGNVYFTGWNATPQIVSTPGSLKGTGANYLFTEKMSAEGNVIYAIQNYAGTMAVDNQGDLFLVAADPHGITPTPGAYQTTTPPENCNVITQNGPACDNAQYVVGINSAGTALLFATYLTSGGGEAPAGIAVDTGGNVYVAGTTGSPNYPTTPGVLEPEFQAQEPSPSGDPATGYVSALNANGTALVFSTYFGGSDYDGIGQMFLDQKSDLIYLTGTAASPDLPGIFGIYRNCVPQYFLSALSADGSAVTRTQTIGVVSGYGPAVAIGPNNIAWLANGYLAQANLDAPDTPIACLADSAGVFVTSSVTPGQLLTIYGNGLSTDTSAPQPLNGFYPTSGASASVTINGIPAPILYESPHQLNVQVPFEIAGQSTATIQITNVDSRIIPVTASAPSLFEVAAESVGCMPAYLGQKVTLALNQDGTVNGCGNPARARSTITIFADGFGVTSPAQATGAVVTSATPLYPQPIYPSPPTLVSSTALVGSISGVYELQIQLPGPGTYQLGSLQGDIQVQVVQ